MRKSSIRKQRHAKGSPLSLAIGLELKRLRVAAGLTQAAVGHPFTRAFVSAVEHGYTVPSIPALAVLTGRLDTSLDVFFQGVNAQMTRVYSRAHGNGEDPTSRRRR